MVYMEILIMNHLISQLIFRFHSVEVKTVVSRS